MKGCDMENKEVSVHEAKAYNFIKQQTGWVTHGQIAEGAGIAERTARAYTVKWGRLGVIEQAAVFPGHRYKLADKAANNSYVRRLETVCQILGIGCEPRKSK